MRNRTGDSGSGGGATVLVWQKCDQDRWCRLADLDLSRVTDFGLYVIWHAGYPSRVVKVGHGDIAARLEEDRRNGAVLHYGRHGPLFVTWAAADASVVEGAARHLADTLRPLLGGGPSREVDPIALNSPF
jgi:hypothetical protein